ncbi:MAG: dTDP-4-dehydrorhamnose 3,5-epimerase [bacterium]
MNSPNRLQVHLTHLPDVLILEPQLHQDSRGSLMESYNRRDLEQALGQRLDFPQENHSQSGHNVLRGLHYQVQKPQGKLVRVVRGEVFDVAVDLRQGAPTFGKWTGVRLSAENRYQLWIPPGFAHGFLVLSETAETLYKMTDYWAPEHERVLRWDDPHLGIEWPLSAPPVLSPKDALGQSLSDLKGD